MNIAFFSESNFDGKIQRDFDNMRTEYAWYVGLDATHHYVGHLPSMEKNIMISDPKRYIQKGFFVDSASFRNINYFSKGKKLK